MNSELLPPADETPLVSWPDLLERFDGDLDLIREIVGVLHVEIGANLSDLKAAIEARDFPAVARLAHILRGATGNFEAPRIVDLASELEQAATEGDDVDFEGVYSRLDSSIRQLLRELDQHLA